MKGGMSNLAANRSGMINTKANNHTFNGLIRKEAEGIVLSVFFDYLNAQKTYG